MSRNPFVQGIQVRRKVLDDEIARLHELPYSVLLELMKEPITKIVKARDNRSYRVTVSADFVAESQNIRVTLSLSTNGLLRRRVIRQHFVITPDNQFRA